MKWCEILSCLTVLVKTFDQIQPKSPSVVHTPLISNLCSGVNKSFPSCGEENLQRATHGIQLGLELWTLKFPYLWLGFHMFPITLVFPVYLVHVSLSASVPVYALQCVLNLSPTCLCSRWTYFDHLLPVACFLQFLSWKVASLNLQYQPVCLHLITAPNPHWDTLSNLSPTKSLCLSWRNVKTYSNISSGVWSVSAENIYNLPSLPLIIYSNAVVVRVIPVRPRCSTPPQALQQNEEKNLIIL